MSTTQDQRSLQLSTPLAKDFLLINRLRCREGLNKLFSIELELLHEEIKEGFTPTVVDPAEVLGKPMVAVAIQAHNAGQKIERYFHGICVNFTQGSRNGRFTSYRAELVPQVWMLTQVKQSRIFQNRSVPEILTEVLQGYEYDMETLGTFEPRNYCVQYCESDWDFASRLMEEEGIFYYFEHTDQHHRLIIGNTPGSHRPCPSLSKVPFALVRSELQEDWIPAIYSWSVGNRIRTGKCELRDFNFQLPAHVLQASQSSLFDLNPNRQLENYEWVGGYAKRFDGIDQSGAERPADLAKVFADRERTVCIRQEEIDVSYRTTAGSADCCTLTAGYKFDFSEHPVKANNISHVLVEVQHEADQSPSYISDRSTRGAYKVYFISVPHGAGHAPFRPERKTPKPMIYGGQTAFVVGNPGDEILTDKYGRVKVHFHWDRSPHMDSRSSCWLRVAHTWAGKGWGSVFIPRVGMEVFVNFLEGDPDQPIIAGRVYNSEQMPPYTLPEHKTRSTIKTRSSNGGRGFNELRFEDKKGKEQIFIHAQKNQDIRVNNDCLETIGSNRHLIVGGEQRERVNADKHLQVAGDLYEKIESSTSLQVGGDKDEKIGSKYALESGKEIHLKAGMKVVIEAGVQLTLKGPGGFIDIGPAGVTVQGTMVLINGGGSAGSGSGASPTSPKLPKAADTADAGQKPELPPAPPPPPSRTFAKLKAVVKKLTKEEIEAGERTTRYINYGFGKDLIPINGLRALIAANKGAPFIKKTKPDAPMKELKTDEDYFEVAEKTGLPIAGPDGSIYTANSRSRSKRTPLTEEEKLELDEYYWDLAEKTGKPVKTADGWTYDVPSGNRQNKRKLATPEEIKRFSEEDRIQNSKHPQNEKESQ